MTNFLRTLEAEVSAWPNVSIHPHRSGGREFRFGNAEVGHVHIGGIVDIPFPRSIRDALLAEGLAEERHWVPNSGWTTFRIRSEEGLSHALWLMRLSYIRYALKTATDPQKLFEQESEQLHLGPQFKSLLEHFVSRTANHLHAEPRWFSPAGRTVVPAPIRATIQDGRSSRLWILNGPTRWLRSPKSSWSKRCRILS